MENQLQPILIKDLGLEIIGNRKRRFGLYECPICKNSYKARTDSIKNRHSTKCIKCNHKSKETHGMFYSKIYKVWNTMKQRCLNIKSKYYINYGGRGITIADEWLKFESFYEWALNNNYKDGLTIDRIDNNKGYFPDNCRWVDMNIQARNKRICKNNTSGFKGVNKNKNNWMARIMVNKKSIFLGQFNTPIEAAKAYDDYIKQNNLEHTLNFI